MRCPAVAVRQVKGGEIERGNLNEKYYSSTEGLK